MPCKIILVNLLAALLVTNSACASSQQAASSPSLQAELATAQAAGDLEQVQALLAQGQALLGDRAGLSATPDPDYPLPDVPLLTVAQARAAFAPLTAEMQRIKWWRIGEDPTQNTRKPRDVVAVISGSVAAYRAGCEEREEILALARDAGDYLLWTQQQAEVGLIPFPASVAGEGKVFGIAKKARRQIEQEGTADQFIRNGWFIEDQGLDDGGLQLDNGLGGVALLELYRVTQEQKYLDGAIRAAEWAATRPDVPNWNYNGFSVELLAEAYRETGRREFLEVAKRKMTLGVLPGQLTTGPRAGRWLDPHNASPNYHYILVRAIARYVSVLEADDPAREPAVSALKLALSARNADYLDGTVPNIESTLDALLVMEQVLGDSTAVVGDLGQREVIDAVARIPVAQFHQQQRPVSPGVWGRLLEYWINGA